MPSRRQHASRRIPTEHHVLLHFHPPFPYNSKQPTASYLSLRLEYLPHSLTSASEPTAPNSLPSQAPKIHVPSSHASRALQSQQGNPPPSHHPSAPAAETQRVRCNTLAATFQRFFAEELRFCGATTEYFQDATGSFDWDGPGAEADWEPMFGSRFYRESSKWLAQSDFSLRTYGSLAGITGIMTSVTPFPVLLTSFTPLPPSTNPN